MPEADPGPTTVAAVAAPGKSPAFTTRRGVLGVAAALAAGAAVPLAAATVAGDSRIVAAFALWHQLRDRGNDMAVAADERDRCHARMFYIESALLSYRAVDPLDLACKTWVLIDSFSYGIGSGNDDQSVDTMHADLARLYPRVAAITGHRA